MSLKTKNLISVPWFESVFAYRILKNKKSIIFDY